MKNKLAMVILGIGLCPVICLPQEKPDYSLSIYNSNIGIVKDQREVELKKGISKIQIQDVAQGIDPTTVKLRLKSKILEQNFKYDLINTDKILERYIGRDIDLIGENGVLVSGKLLSSYSGRLVLEKKDGGLIMISDLDKYRISVGSLPEGLDTKPTLEWLLDSPSDSKEKAEITYQTQGLNWHAEYVAMLNDNEDGLDLNSWVSIENSSGATYRDASVKLVAGDLNIVKQNRAGMGMPKTEMYRLTDASSQFEEKPFFEYHIYDLGRRTTIAQNESKQISLFEAAGIKARKSYLYKSSGPQENGNVNVIISFDNRKENGLGIPLPQGKIRLFKMDGNSAVFLGEDAIKHRAKNEEVRISAGSAFDIRAKEIEKDSKQISQRVSEHSFELSITNSKSEPVDLTFERSLGSNWEITESSIPWEKKDASTAQFRVHIDRENKTVITFKIRYSY